MGLKINVRKKSLTGHRHLLKNDLRRTFSRISFRAAGRPLRWKPLFDLPPRRRGGRCERRWKMNLNGSPGNQGLYDPRYEHDACGVGFVVDIKNRKNHQIVCQGLEILVNLTHRGAVGADPLAGDGAGILIQLPDGLLRPEAAALGIALPEVGSYGVGMLFLPQDREIREQCEAMVAHTVVAEGQQLLGWRGRAGRQRYPGRQCAGLRTGYPSIVHRARGGDRRSGRLRAQAVRHPQKRLDRHPRPLRGQGQELFIFPRCRRGPSSTRECCWPSRSGPITTIFEIRA